MRTLHVKLFTPHNTLLDVEREMVIMPGADGELSVMYRHEPMIVSLTAGFVKTFNYTEVVEVVIVSNGLAKIEHDKCTVLAEHALYRGKYTISWVEQELKVAEEKLMSHGITQLHKQSIKNRIAMLHKALTYSV